MENKKRGWNNIRAQVTVFIIIGIIVVFSTALVIYLRGEAMKHKPALKEVLEEIPLEFHPIRNYVKVCVGQIGKEAVHKLSTGGYIDIMDPMLSKTTFKISEDNLRSDVLNFVPGSDFKIPYWFYLTSRETCGESDPCLFSSKRPNLYKAQGGSNLESQIEEYIEENIDECLLDFSEFRQQGFEVKRSSDPKAEVVITNLGVDILLDYPLKIEKDGVVQTVSKFFNTLDVNLKKVYDAALNILTVQVDQQFLEKHTLNLLEGLGRFDESRIPPMMGYSFDCSDASKTWILSDVRDNMITPMLLSYIPMVKFVGAMNFRLLNLDDSFKNAVLNEQMIMLTDEEKILGLEARAHYLGWKPYLKIRPSRGEVITPSLTICLRSLIRFGFVEAKYDYDMSYPVLFEVKDPEAFGGEGYSFYFAVESNIRNSFPLNGSVFEDVDMPEAPLVGEFPLFCDKEQRISGDITIKVKDGRTGEAVDDVLIDFCIPDNTGRCNREEEICDLKPTSKFETENGISKQKLPLGIGLLRFYKDDYHPAAMVYSTAYEVDDTVEVTLEPYREIKVHSLEKLVFTTKQKTRKDECGKDETYYKWIYPIFSIAPEPDEFGELPLTEIGSTSFGAEFEREDLEDDERVIITLTRLNASYQEHITITSFEGNNVEDEYLRLIPGNYLMEMSIFKEKELVIPEREQCICDPESMFCNTNFGCNYFDDTCHKTQVINETKLSTISLGGAVMEIEIEKDDLDSGKKLKFYAVTPDFEGFKTLENLQIMGDAENLAQYWPIITKPDWK